MFVTVEERNTLVVEAVSSNESAIHIDREANIGGYYLHLEDGVSHRTKRR